MPVAQLNSNPQTLVKQNSAPTALKSAAATGNAAISVAPESPDRYRPSESKPDWMQLGRQNGMQSAFAVASPSRVQKAMSDSRVKATVSGFSPELQQQISGLSDPQLNVLKGGMTGTTEFGPFTVDNRKAFIKGTAYGKSIWGNVHQSISDARSKYSMINGPEENGLHKLINSVSQLKPEERKILADLMDSIR